MKEDRDIQIFFAISLAWRVKGLSHARAHGGVSRALGCTIHALRRRAAPQRSSVSLTQRSTCFSAKRTRSIPAIATSLHTTRTRAIPFLFATMSTTSSSAPATKNPVERVWDYPRPPSCERVNYKLEVYFNNELIASTTEGYKVCETTHPPCYYIPPKDISMKFLKPVNRQTFCEWKGGCSYYDVAVGDKVAHGAAWFYSNPTSGFKDIKNHVCFYASKMDACFVEGEKVTPQAGDFYGGWITSWIDGGQNGFKGARGTEGW